VSATTPDDDLGPIPPPPDPRPPDGYRLGRRLGRGGGGEVYAAVQTALGRTVAVKFLRPDGFARPDLLARFRLEATSAAGLRHPNVVQVYEAGMADGRPFLALEYVPGGTLADALAAGPLAPRPAAELVRRVAAAVAAAHAAGVVHRDLKPGNILLAEDGTPKVTDFGLAKPVAGADTPTGGLTATGAVLGTPAYMAPEQAAGRPDVGPSADVYAVGAVLYECLTGRPPFRAAGAVETLDLVRTADPVPVRQLQPAVPRDLETVCLKCLRKAPADRYPSAAALADDLDRFLAGRPVHARPVGRVEWAARWAKRNPAAAALLAVAVLVPLLAAGGFALHSARLAAALAEQTRQRGRADTNYAAAREAIVRMLGRTAERTAAPVPELFELERKQAADALAFFRAAVTVDAEADPAVRFQLAQAVARLGQRTAEVGDPAAAVALNREAGTAFDALLAADPGNREYRFHRGQTRGWTGFALLGTDPSAADAELAAATDELAALHAENPADAATAHRLGQFLQNRGTLRRRTDKPDEAADFFRRSVAAHDAGMRAEPPNYLRWVMRADAHNGLGLVAWGRKRYPEADAAFAAAEADLAAALRESPASVDAALTLGGVCINAGLSAQDAGRPTDALARFDKAVDGLEAVIRREPQLGRVRGYLYNAHGARGSLLKKLGRHADAAADFERCAAVARPDAVSKNWQDAADEWAAAGRPAEAAAARAKAAVTPPVAGGRPAGQRQ
jgi:serine/threonine-protein kinase